MARLERSAGMIVFRDDTRIKGGRAYLLLDYGHFWDYPKGHIDNDEDDLTAARRELAEETGLTRIEVIDGFRHQIQYFFGDKSKGLIRKIVVFFLARTRQRQIRLSYEHVGSVWLNFEQAVERLTYPTAKTTLQAAEEFLQKIKPSQ